jgi:hypothetical protein
MRPNKILVLLFIFLGLFSCGEEYYATPQKTLQRYVDNRDMSSAVRVEAALNCFTSKDREWWSRHYEAICEARYGKFHTACGSSFQTESTIWADLFEPAGPSTTDIESADVDDKAGTAVLVVNGKRYNFTKEKFNWKFDGLFGMEEEIRSQYPQIEGQ